MKYSCLHSKRPSVLLCLGLGFVLLGSTRTSGQSQPQSQSGTSSPATPADDAAAKAAERKRKFEEQRKLMESGYSPSKEESRRSDPDLMITPSDVNLLVHDRLQFHVYDKGKEVGGGSWSAMPGRILGSWFEKGGVFTIEAKSPGTARVGVMIGSRATSVLVTVYPGDKMPKGVDRPAEVIKPAGSE